jgi:membrane protease YdiL (CAAX protease family)
MHSAATAVGQFAERRARAILAGRRSRIVAAVTAVLVVLTGTNLLKSGPVETGLVVGPLVAVILVILARRAGLSWDDLGLARRRLRRGAGWAALAIAGVTAVYLAAIAVPELRAAFLDVRYRLDVEAALLKALVMIPLSTIVLEEIAFRGVLFGLLHRRRRVAWAFGFSSSLFGLWHIFPSLPTDGFPFLPGGQLAAAATVAGITAVLGLLLCELRRRSGSLLAAVAGHWAANGLGVLLAALVWSWH